MDNNKKLTDEDLDSVSGGGSGLIYKVACSNCDYYEEFTSWLDARNKAEEHGGECLKCFKGHLSWTNVR